MAVFQNFLWDSSVLDNGNKVVEFKKVNIFYGRNYSGKTTLSRLLRAMETGKLSDKYENPSFLVTFADGSQTTHSDLTTHGKKIRVFNEDFIRDNLRFITNPDDSVEPFAILGDDNNKIEKDIEKLEAELGSKEEGKETGLYADRKQKNLDFEKAEQAYTEATNTLNKQLSDKATERTIGIKYKPERFGDQNYNIQKLKSDIEKILDKNYQPSSDEELVQHEKLITEKLLQPLPLFQTPNLNFPRLAAETEALVTKSISELDKIEELVKEAALNLWVKEGRTHHKHKRNKCAFCNNPITENRWKELEKHFDEESEQLEKAIDNLNVRIEVEKKTVASILSIDKACFYSKFHGKIDELDNMLKDAVDKYGKSLDALTTQLKIRKDDILNAKSFERQDDASDKLVAVWESYDIIRNESGSFSQSLSKEQAKAKEALRLKEISDYLITIKYNEQISSIKDLKSEYDDAGRAKARIKDDIYEKEGLIVSKKRELHDEEKGAKKVNDYLNNFFGHQFLSLQATKVDSSAEDSKRIRFEVIRDGKKAYHLSEGECSLLAFCYFLAKLDDTDTKDAKPIIWIDDPISSLDGNHIFFIYSLISQEIVGANIHSQLFISTHNLDFLKYLKRLPDAPKEQEPKEDKKKYQYFIVERMHEKSVIRFMPEYLKKYVTEFNYLFEQIYNCAYPDVENDESYYFYYNFGNNARKFLEAYLYYKYPNAEKHDDKLARFLDGDKLELVSLQRINNEFSHLEGVIERSLLPVDTNEMKRIANFILQKIQENDPAQYDALLKSIGKYTEPPIPPTHLLQAVS